MHFERYTTCWPWAVLLMLILGGLFYLPSIIGANDQPPRVRRDTDIISKRIDYWVMSDNSELEAWKAKWSPRMERCEVVGGCSCCLEVRGWLSP